MVSRDYILKALRESVHHSHCADNAENAGYDAKGIIDFLISELDHQYDRAQHYHDRANEWESNYRDMCKTCDEIENRHREDQIKEPLIDLTLILGDGILTTSEMELLSSRLKGEEK